MALAWVPNDITLGPSQVVGASATDTPISKEFKITSAGARMLVAAVKVSAVTVTTGITAKLQTTMGELSYVDSKTATISSNGTVYIKLLAENSSDQTYLPLLNKGRIVLTTGTGDTATIDSVLILVED